jgi:predicted nucleic acid-binding protein
MLYLIDTDRLIDHLANDPATQQLLIRLAGAGIAMSVISYMELYQGVVQNPEPEAARAKLAALLAVVPMQPFTREVAETCGRIRADLQRKGKRVRPRALDLQIAATAITAGLVLVTRNVDDYSDISELCL